MILCIGAHPDDIELGAGGILSNNTEPVWGLCLTAHSAFSNLLPEMLKSWDQLGIIYQDSFKQDFEHRNFNRQSVLDLFIEIKNELKPDIILTHSSFDCHQDHKVIYQESIRAFKNSTILGYDLGWNNVSGSDYRFYRELSEDDVADKLKALSCYKSQQSRPYFNINYQMGILRTNGAHCGTKYAERFEVIRCVERS